MKKKSKGRRKKVDIAHEMTDRELLNLENRISKVYREAEKDVQKEMSIFLSNFKKKDAEWKFKLDKGEAKIEEYQEWLKKQVFRGEQWQLQRQMIADTLYNANQTALEMINNKIPKIFALNSNYVAFDLEKKAEVDLSFHLYNTSTIRKLLVEDAKILPFKKLKKGKDVLWNFQSIRNEVAKGIIKGESVDKIANRLYTVIPDRNNALMKMRARTAVTSAQNQGRMERFKEAQSLGINVKKKWVATIDARTRFSHLMLNGQIRDIDDYFEVDGLKIKEPGDPFAHPSLTCNCRCTMNSILVDFPQKFTEDRDKETGEPIKDMDFDDWQKYKKRNGLLNLIGLMMISKMFENWQEDRQEDTKRKE